MAYNSLDVSPSIVAWHSEARGDTSHPEGTAMRTRRGVFVNYRVGDCHNEAAFIAHELIRNFGTDSVFFASHSIRPGDDFPMAIAEGLRRCSVLVAIIGPDWLTISGGDDRRRIAMADDWVRHEIREALRLGMHVVPVLVEGQHRLNMPAGDDLPDDIAALARCQYIRMHYQELNLEKLVNELARTI